MATENIVLYDSERDRLVEAYVSPADAQRAAKGKYKLKNLSKISFKLYLKTIKHFFSFVNTIT